MDFETQHSALDKSVNFIAKSEDGGAFECRYVRREEAYAIAYISSQTGCNQACRFCHLTQSKQTTMGQATHWDLMSQLMRVLRHQDECEKPAERFHVNFMARGEPLMNPAIMNGFDLFADRACHEIRRRGMEPVFNISSIFPKDAVRLDFFEAFGNWPVTLFWSLYSLRPAFRKRWLPKAREPGAILEDLLRWQERSGRDVVIHHALIEGHNDDEDDFFEIRDFLKRSGLRARLNLVRYNPFSERSGVEAAEGRYEEALKIIGEPLIVPGSRIVPRVGRDVHASCGMFVRAGL